jgi:hypothetical protein
MGISLYLQGPVLATCTGNLHKYTQAVSMNFFIQAAVRILTDINITGGDESEEGEEEAIAVNTMLDEGMGKHDLPNIYFNLEC